MTSTGISWGTRFIMIGTGRNTSAGSGYFELSMPADGVVIPVYGSTGGTTSTVTAGKILLGNNQALYYDVPLGSTTAVTDSARYKIVDYNASMIDVPPSWVLVALRTSDPSITPSIMWGDGMRQDYWRTPTLQNSWVNYGSSWPGAAYRIEHDGKIRCRGLVKSGTIGVTSPIFTVPAAMAPEGTSGVGALNMQPCNGGSCRMDVLGSGMIVIISFNTGGTNAHVSLENLSWYPAGA